MDNADQIAEFELEILETISRMHYAGIRFEAIHFILSGIVKNLELQGNCENWLKNK